MLELKEKVLPARVSFRDRRRRTIFYTPSPAFCFIWIKMIWRFPVRVGEFNLIWQIENEFRVARLTREIVYWKSSYFISRPLKQATVCEMANRIRGVIWLFSYCVIIVCKASLVIKHSFYLPPKVINHIKTKLNVDDIVLLPIFTFFFVLFFQMMKLKKIL